MTQQAWIRENDFRRLQDEFNAMTFIDPKDARYKFPEAQYTHFNSFIQIFIQTFMRNPAVQYNFWSSCLNPLAEVMVQILTGKIIYIFQLFSFLLIKERCFPPLYSPFLLPSIILLQAYCDILASGKMSDEK